NEFIDESSELVILEPENWIGKEFPLVEYLSPRVDFGTGKSIVLLYHHDCPECQRALPRYVAEAEDTDGASKKVVLIEVPPIGPPGEYGAAMHAVLRDDIDWFVQAPVEILVDGGKITDVLRDRLSVELDGNELGF